MPPLWGERVKGGLTLKLHLWSLFLTVWSGCGPPAGDNFVELCLLSIYWSCCCLYGSFQLSSSLKSPPYLCECAGRNSKYGCAVLEKLCEAGTVTGTGGGLAVASPTDVVWFPKQVKYIHSGLCFLEGTNREVYLTLFYCFNVFEQGTCDMFCA